MSASAGNLLKKSICWFTVIWPILEGFPQSTTGRTEKNLHNVDVFQGQNIKESIEVVYIPGGANAFIYLPQN